MVLRSMYPPFLHAVERYFDALADVISIEQVSGEELLFGRKEISRRVLGTTLPTATLAFTTNAFSLAVCGVQGEVEWLSDESCPEDIFSARQKRQLRMQAMNED